MQLRNKSSNLSIASQISISSVSSAAKSFITRKFRKSETGKLRHTQSMPLAASRGENAIQKKTISPPLLSSAVDTARGRYIRQPADLFNTIQVPLALSNSQYRPIRVQDHWLPAGDFSDDPSSIFEPRPPSSDLDPEKENIFEPRPSEYDTPDFTPYVAPLRINRARAVSLTNKYRCHQWTSGTYNPRQNGTGRQAETSGIHRPLSPVREEDDPSRRYAGFSTFNDLTEGMRKLERE